MPSRSLIFRYFGQHLRGKQQCMFSTGVTNVVTDAKVDSTARDKKTFLLPNVKYPKSLYGGRFTVAMLNGDGIGPEMMKHVERVIKEIAAPVDFEIVNIGNNPSKQELHDAVLAIKRNGVAIKGNMETLAGSVSRNLVIRDKLNLFAYVQHAHSFPGVKTRHDNIDIVVIRENTEGEYSRLEHESVKGVVESLKIITEAKSRRIAKYAFDYATEHNRKLVTCVHKANIMKLGDGMFLSVCEEVSKEYPDIKFNSMIVDNTCMQLVSRPQQFDVMVLPNLYGNIVGNVTAGLVGGAGLTAGVNIGEDCAVFESGTRNSGRSLVGQNVANPCALLLASANMLDYLGLKSYGSKVRNAVFNTTSERKLLTSDLGGNCSTTDFVDAVLQSLENL